MQEHEQPSSVGPHLLCEDELQSGIWPRSFSFWVITFWMALLVIRPWEQLFLELAALRVELVYSIFAIVVVMCSNSFQLRSSMQTTALLAWGAALSISTLFAYDVSIAWQGLYVYLTTFLFYFILLTVIRSAYTLVFFVAAIVAVTTVYLAKAQWEYFLHEAGGFAMGVHRLRGIDITYAHPNAVACTAVLTLPFLGTLWHMRKQFTATWPGFYQRHFPAALVVSLAIIVTSVVLTNSRSGLLGVILATFLWTFHRYGTRRWIRGLFSAAIILLCIWVLLSEDSKSRFRNLWDPESGPHAESAHMSAEGRLEGLKQGWEMFKRFPATGVGPGNFLPYRVAHLDGVNLIAHNTVGAVLGETGTIGGLAFLFFVGSIFVTCNRTKAIAVHLAPDEAETLLEVALAARNSAILILFLGFFGDVQSRMQLYWAAAICLLAYEIASSRAVHRQVGTAESRYA